MNVTMPWWHRRKRSRFEMWALGEVIVLRVAVVITYAVYAYAGVISFIAGVPLFTLTAPIGYAAPWGAALFAAASVAAIASTTDRWNKAEKWSAGVLVALVSAYVFGLNIVGFASQDVTRQFGGAIAMAAFVLPCARVGWLVLQSGKRRADDSR